MREYGTTCVRAPSLQIPVRGSVVRDLAPRLRTSSQIPSPLDSTDKLALLTLHADSTQLSAPKCCDGSHDESAVAFVAGGC